MGSIDEIISGGGNTPGDGTPSTLNDAQMGYINSVKPRGDSNSLSVEDFHPIIPDNLSPEEQTMFNQQNFNEDNPAISPLPVSEYYPGIGEPIAKGTYSGPHIGSLTLFAPGGGYIPYGVVDAREKAIQGAADQKAAQIQNFYNRFKSPVTNHSVVQNQIDEGFYSQLQGDILPYLQKKYGKNWTKGANTDTHVQSWVRNWNTLKDQEDFMSKDVARLESEIKTGDFVATPELLQKLNDYYVDSKGLTEGAANPNGKKLADTVLAYRTERELNKVLNEAAKELKYSVAESYGINKADPDYDLIVSTKVKSMPDENLRAASKRMKEQLYSNSKYITEDKIFNGLKAMFPGESEKQLQTVTRPKQTAAEAENYDTAVPQTDVKLNVETPDGQSELYFDKGYNTSANDGGKEITLALNSNMQDTQGNELQKATGFVAGKVQMVGNLPYNKASGKFYTPAQAASMKKEGILYNNHNIEFKTAAVFNVTPTAENKGKVEGQNTLIVPIGDIKGKFVNAKKRTGQQDYEDKIVELENDAKSQNEKVKTAAQKKPVTTTKKIKISGF